VGPVDDARHVVLDVALWHLVARGTALVGVCLVGPFRCRVDLDLDRQLRFPRFPGSRYVQQAGGLVERLVVAGDGDGTA